MAQNDAMSADISGSRICSSILCALIGSAIHYVFVIGQSNHKLWNVLFQTSQQSTGTCVLCVCLLYAEMGHQPLRHECAFGN